MSWVRIESSVARHRKFQQAGPAASWLWVCGLCYCQEGLTDGFISFEALPYLGVKSASKHASVLVKVGLWEHCDGGWAVHDYLSHNRAASHIRGIQEERRRSGSEGGRASGLARRSTDAKQFASGVAEASAKQTANPSTDQISTATETERTDSSAALRASEPAVLTFPTIGSGAKTWDLTEAQCAEWRAAYPGLDVLGECRQALAWVYANQKKTAKGMPAFLVNWLNRSVARGGRGPMVASKVPAWMQ